VELANIAAQVVVAPAWAGRPVGAADVVGDHVVEHVAQRECPPRVFVRNTKFAKESSDIVLGEPAVEGGKVLYAIVRGGTFFLPAVRAV